MSEPLTGKELELFRVNFVEKLKEPMRSDFRRVVDTIADLEAENARLQERVEEAEALTEKQRKALRETARVYHEAKHFMLAEVDRERFPSYRECPYWPCVDARAAIDATPEEAEKEEE